MQALLLMANFDYLSSDALEPRLTSMMMFCRPPRSWHDGNVRALAGYCLNLLGAVWRKILSQQSLLLRRSFWGFVLSLTEVRSLPMRWSTGSGRRTAIEAGTSRYQCFDCVA